jgi:hypothetical protein
MIDKNKNGRFEVGQKIATFKCGENGAGWIDVGTGIVISISYGRANEATHLRVLTLDKEKTDRSFGDRNIDSAENLPVLSDRFYCAPF